MSERVRVAVRIRPFLPSDPPDADLTTLLVDDTHVCCGGQRVFRVDEVYKMEDDTDQVYERSVRPVVGEYLKGFNATVMAYGQTGTGKTYTISGLLPLIFGQIVNEGFNGSTEELSFQYLEVYGDSLRDLLSDDPVGSAKALHIYDGNNSGAEGGGRAHSPLSPSPPAAAVAGEAREQPTNSPSGGFFVSGALRVTASSLNEVFDILAFGAANRATGATQVHQHSSRSHSVFTVFNHRTGGKLHVVDLAGSERNKKTHNVGQRLQESIAINGGLLALGNVIRALSRNHHHHSQRAHGGSPSGGAAPGGSTPSHPSPGPAGHVPYRSSKLTRLLQDALGGNGKTIFIACVAPDSHNRDETLRTLQYCALAVKVVNAPTKPSADDPYRRLMHGHRQTTRQEGGDGLAHGGSPDSATDARGEGSSSSSSPLFSFDVNGTPRAALQQQLDMLGAFCEEQEAEIVAMRERLADSDGKLRVCEEELRKDEHIFSRQMAEMERLVQENKELRRRLAERTKTEQQQVEQYRQLLDAARDPKEQLLPHHHHHHHGDAQSANVDRQSPDIDHTETNPVREVDPLKKTLPYLRRTFASTDTATAAVSSTASRDRLMPFQQPQQQQQGYGAREVEEVHVGEAAHLPGQEDADRDEQLLALTKEALHYQRANTQLRHELSAAKVALESQKRDAAMLRLELSDLQQLLS